jgi:WD40 repeat protein
VTLLATEPAEQAGYLRGRVGFSRSAVARRIGLVYSAKRVSLPRIDCSILQPSGEIYGYWPVCCLFRAPMARLHIRVGWVAWLGLALPFPAAVPSATVNIEQLPNKTPPTRNDRYGDPLPEGAIARIGTLRLRQASAVTSLVFSRDGAVLFAAGALDAEIKSIPCWETATGKLRRRIACQEYGAYCLALSPDGQTLASVSEGRNDIWLLDVATGKMLHRLAQEKGGVTHIAAAFSPDGTTLASAGAGGVLLWDVATGKLRKHFPDWGHCWNLSYAPDGKMLAGGGGNAAHLGDTLSGKEVWKVELGDRGYAIAFAPDGSAVAAGDADGHVRILEPSTGKELRRLSGHKGPVTAVAFAPDGKTFASGGYEDRTVRIWNMMTGKQAHCLQLSNRASVWALAFAPDAKTVASGGTDQTVRLWNVADGTERLPFLGQRDFVTVVAFADDGKGLAAADFSGGLCLWDPASGERICKFPGHFEPINSIAIAPDRKKLVSGCWGAKVVVWDVKTQKELLELNGHKDRIYAVAFSPDGSLVATASIDSTVRLWHAATGKEIRQMEGGEVWKWVKCLAFSPDGRHLATARESGIIHLCEVETGKEIRRFVGHKRSVSSLAISSDGRLLASGGEDGIVRIWDFSTGKELRKSVRELRRVTSVAFAPDSRTVVSGDEGSTVCLWEVASGEEIRVFEGHTEMVYSVAFAPDGRSVASGSRDFTILIWDITGRLGEPDAPAAKSADIERLWESLADSEAARAHRALWRLVRSPALSVPVIRERLRVVEPVPKARIAALVADLDAKRFDAREEAFHELQRLGELAAPALQEALASRPSLELRLRAERLMNQVQAPVPPPHRLRLGRALAVLEQINSPQSRDLLERLAGGAEGAWLTQEARASLKRFTKQH